MKLQLQECKINLIGDVYMTFYYTCTSCIALIIKMHYQCQLTSYLSLGLPPRSSAVYNT